MPFNFNPDMQHKTEISARKAFSGLKIFRFIQKVNKNEWQRLKIETFWYLRLINYIVCSVKCILCKNGTFVSKWYFCVKMIFLCPNDMFRSKWYFCVRMIFLWPNDMFGSKWYVWVKMIFLCQNDAFVFQLFFLAQKCSFVLKRHFL